MPDPKPPIGTPIGNLSYVDYLVSLWLLQEGYPSWTDYVNASNTGVSGPSSPTVTGQLATFTGAGGVVGITNPPLNGVVYTVMIRLRPANLSGGYRSLYANSSFGFFQLADKFLWYNQSASSGSLVTSGLQTITFRRDSTGVIDYFLDGVFDSTRTSIGVPFPDNGLNLLGIGADSAGENFIGDIDYVAIWNAYISDADIATIGADPYYAFFARAAAVIEYENPCDIVDPLIHWSIRTETDTFKIGIQPIREPAAMGGYAVPRGLDMSPIVRAASDPASGAWQAQTASLRNADTDRVLRAASDARTSFRNASGDIYITSKANSLAGGPPRILFSGKVRSDSADENLVLGFNLNDLISDSYSLFSEEKQIPQRQISRTYFPNAKDDVIDRGEPILGGRVAPLSAAALFLNGKPEGIVPCITVGRITVNGTAGIPTGTTLAAVVAALQSSVTGGTAVLDWGGRIGFADAQMLQDLGTVPSDFDGLASIIGYDDLNALLNETAVTGGSEYVAAMVASHAINQILTGYNSDPSVWIDALQLDPAELGTQWWAPQISGDTTWASDISTDLFSDILGTDGTTRRYTLILFAPGSTYGDLVEAGGTVHLDCLGMEDAGDGTGDLIEDAFALYRHLLVNFLLQDYQTGGWLSVPQFLFSDGVTLLDRLDMASFDTASTVAAIQTPGGRLGSFRIADRTSIRDILPNCNNSWGCLIAPDDYGRLFIKTLDFRRSRFLDGHPVLRDKVDFITGFSVEPKPDWQVNRLSYEYAMNYYTGQWERPAGGGGVKPLEYVAGQIRDGVLKKTLTMPYTRQDLTALHVAGNYRDMFANMPHVLHYVRRGLCGLEDDVLDGVPVRHYNGYGANGYQDRAVWILSKTFQKTLTTAFTALDVDALISAEDPPPPEALLADPVGSEALFSDDTAEPLYADG